MNAPPVSAQQGVSPKHHGKVCAKHPELEGLRYTRGYQCVACKADNQRDYYANNAETLRDKKNAKYVHKRKAKGDTPCLIKTSLQNAAQTASIGAA